MIACGGARLASRRSLVALFALVVGLLLPEDVHGVVCSTGTTSTTPPPTTAFLRGYWGPLHGPAGIAVDVEGTIYVTDPERSAIVERRADGFLVAVRKGFDRPVAIGVAATGSEPLYVADAATGAVTALSRSFEPLFTLGKGEGELDSPSDIAVDSATGRILVSDPGRGEVAVFDPSGIRVATLDGAPGDPFGAPTGIAIDPLAGEIVIADQLDFRLHVFGPDLVWRRCLGRQGSSAGRFGFPFGVAVDALGRIYVADAYQGRIQIVDALGRHVGYLGEFGVRPGQLQGVADLALDPFGRLFAASASGARLDLFGLDAYADPELFGPLEVDVVPESLGSSTGPDPVPIVLRARGTDLSATAAAAVTINGLEANAARFDDLDGDGSLELVVEIRRIDLLRTLPPAGSAEVAVELQTHELLLVGADRLQVIAGDLDGDGVTDADDLCPDTASGAIVDSGGCALAQLCPCAAPWPNRGTYVECLDLESKRFVLEGLITDRQRASLLRSAARSSCGVGAGGTSATAGARE